MGLGKFTDNNSSMERLPPTIHCHYKSHTHNSSIIHCKDPQFFDCVDHLEVVVDDFLLSYMVTTLVWVPL